MKRVAGSILPGHLFDSNEVTFFHNYLLVEIVAVSIITTIRIPWTIIVRIAVIIVKVLITSTIVRAITADRAISIIITQIGCLIVMVKIYQAALKREAKESGQDFGKCLIHVSIISRKGVEVKGKMILFHIF